MRHLLVSNNHRSKRRPHLIDDLRPVSNLPLPEQPCTGIPRAIVPIQQPSPIRIVGQQYPDRLAHRACKMSYTGIYCDDEIRQVEQCRRITEVSQISAEKTDAVFLAKHGAIFFPDFLLQTDPVSIRTYNREKPLKVHGA